MPHDFLWLIFVLAVAGVGLWVISQLPGVDATMKQFIRVLVIACVAVYVIYFVFVILLGLPMLTRPRG